MFAPVDVCSWKYSILIFLTSEWDPASFQVAQGPGIYRQLPSVSVCFQDLFRKIYQKSLDNWARTGMREYVLSWTFFYFGDVLVENCSPSLAQVLPSICNEVLKATVAQFDAEKLLTEREKV